MRSLGVLAAVGVLALAGSSGAPEPLVAPLALDIAAVFEAPASQWGAGHRGIDLHALTGAVVHAPGDGVITFAGDVAGRGVVVVLHPSGLRSTLEPVTASVAVGDTVNAGDAIGALESASSHCSPEACLHWGVRRGEEYLDPLDVLVGYGPIRLLPLREEVA